MRPQRCRAASTIAASVASLMTSASKATHSPPDCRAMATVSSAEDSLLSTASTLAPSCAKRRTVARPLPSPSPGDWPAPTTIAILSLRRMETSMKQRDGRAPTLRVCPYWEKSVHNRYEQQRVRDHGRTESAVRHQQVTQERHGKDTDDRNSDRVPGVAEQQAKLGVSTSMKPAPRKKNGISNLFQR